MIGYGRPEQFGPIDLRRRTQALRDDLISRIARIFPDDVSIVRPGGRWRTQLRLSNGTTVSVLVARSVRVWKGTVRWLIDPVERERSYVTLLARLDVDNSSFLDFYVLPNVDRSTRIQISQEDPRLAKGVRLNDAAALLTVVERIKP
jgi:hypothetical protein